jgi:23S rRNA pseudouridine2605 synthase
MDNESVKIQKYLAGCGLCSRRGAEDMVRGGRVKVNGVVVTDPAVRVLPGQDRVECDNRAVEPASGANPQGLILYKTAGTVTSAADPHNPQTVYGLLPPAERSRRWIYVGRLDKDSEGLVLFTDSGELAHRLTHPSFKVPKRYVVRVAGQIEIRHLRQLEHGMLIDGCEMIMDRAQVNRRTPETTTLDVILHQGEKRQIRRMLERLGFKVEYLCRTEIGPLKIERLSPGQHRRLTSREMRALEHFSSEKDTDSGQS